jgi:hypothetical protein
MRALTYLNRRWMTGESVVLLASAVAVVFGAQIGLIALGLSQPVAAPVALAVALGAYFATAALIDRRTRI